MVGTGDAGDTAEASGYFASIFEWFCNVYVDHDVMFGVRWNIFCTWKNEEDTGQGVRKNSAVVRAGLPPKSSKNDTQFVTNIP